MFDQYQICPYTGLRSFTEEESLYFKGREDDIDQATLQLQKNKFLMLTGASGDGKSSLIYAGIIPNARAGFLKSKYTQWCVADFRPERTPFQNLCRSVAAQLEVPDVLIVESELQHGFSALADLYRNSKRFTDPQSINWLAAGEKERAVLKREAANLIILVDQFEEFFTNPENYHQGTPSREANLVLNLLLETARIALDEDLPVYVVFTMRSDYIGQCAAFRGLPEYLGFSQYFVPRLNRAQLQQVIEEPAELSGNRISRRLTERLIHDITEGVDQLPILQHALNQIWLAADHGREEMDLLHYAMVGGMSADELPEGDTERFNVWFQGLSPQIRACYHEPNLQNVLDSHTNKLFEQATVYFQEKTGKKISVSDTKAIIRTAFTCLTKIDEGRAVRNRMTLEEITAILGRPDIGVREVGDVINIFREPGNTFIHPFINEEYPETRTIQPNQVLDITHESLIRNWKLLGHWTKEEFDSRSVSLDFEQQLGRWVASDKSPHFLLSIGPLTFFESWYQKAKPNASWIARYLPDEDNREDTLRKAGVLLADSQEFLEKSAARHKVTRTIMRWGTRRIAVTLGIIALLTLTSFAVKNYFDKQNDKVLQQLLLEGTRLAASPKATLISKASFGSEALKLGLTNIDSSLSGLSQPLDIINVSTGLATQLILQGRGQPEALISAYLHRSDSLLSAFPVRVTHPDTAALILKEINDLRSALEHAYVYRAIPLYLELKSKNANRGARWVMQVLDQQPVGYRNMHELTLALEHALHYKSFSAAEMSQLIGVLSPLEQRQATDWVRSGFQKDRMMDRGEQGYGFFFNGLFQQLAYLYAAKGDVDKTLQCMDSLLAYSQNNLQGDYSSGVDNASNIAVYFYRYGHDQALDAFVRGYIDRKKIGLEEFYARLIGRCLRERSSVATVDLFFWSNVKMNLNLRFSDRSQLGYFFDKYRQAVQATADVDQKNLWIALSYKNEGILKWMTAEPPLSGEMTQEQYFGLAMEYYDKVSPVFLQQNEKVIGLSGADEKIVPRSYLFVYPDLRLSFHPLEPRAFIHYYLGDAFMTYILDKGLFTRFYGDQQMVQTIAEWIQNYNVRMFYPTGFAVRKIGYPILQRVGEETAKVADARRFDFNLLYLYLGREAQLAGDNEAMISNYRRVQPENLLNNLRTKEFGNNVNNHVFRLIGNAVQGFAEAGRVDEMLRLLRVFKKASNRSSLYAFAAAEILKAQGDRSLAIQLIDSSRTELGRTENVQGAQFNRRVLAGALALLDPEGNRNEIERLMKNLPQKLGPLGDWSSAFAFRNQLYPATHNLPSLVSDDDLVVHLWAILKGYGDRTRDDREAWKDYNQYYLDILVRNIEYEDESS